jgi:hypothetical protein
MKDLGAKAQPKRRPLQWRCGGRPSRARHIGSGLGDLDKRMEARKVITVGTCVIARDQIGCPLHKGAWPQALVTSVQATELYTDILFTKKSFLRVN